MIDPTVGDRIVIRYRLDYAGAPSDWRAAPNPASSTGPSQSDVTGLLVESDTRAVRVDRDGEVVAIPRGAITSIRLLSRRVVRNSEIRDVERALCAGCDATDRTEIDGWSVCAGGSTPRGRGAVPVEFNAPSAAVAEILGWYADLDEAPLALIPDRLVRPGRVTVDDAHEWEVLVADSPAVVDSASAIQVSDDLWAIEIPADDAHARTAARAAGYELHHTVTVGELVDG